MQTAIERLELAGLSAADVGRWLDRWKALRAEGWAVTVLAEQRPARAGVDALVGLAVLHEPSGQEP